MPVIRQRYQLKCKLPDKLRRVTTLSELLGALLSNDVFPTGVSTAPHGKYSSLRETMALTHQYLFHSIRNKALREDHRETWFLNVLYAHSNQVFSSTEGDPAEAE